MYDIIIVGGGAAGLMAAKILSAKGQKILLLEAREHLGGRIHGLENFGIAAEGGAEFIHGNLKTTFALLKEAGIKKVKVKGELCRVQNGKWKVSEDFMPYRDLLLKKMNDCKEDISIKDFLRDFSSAKKYDALKKQFTRYIEGYDAADTKDTSVFAIRKGMEEEDEDQFRPVPDYSALIDFLKETCLRNNTKIKTGEPVLQITRGRNIQVITSLAKYNCRKIIIAVPLGILQGRPGEGFINFPECLSEYISAAKTIGNGNVIKFLMKFEEAFWLNKEFLDKKNIPAPSYIFTDTAIPTYWTQYPSSNPLLTGWIAGPASDKMKNYSEKKFRKTILESLSSIFLMPVEHLRAKLKKLEVINWVKEPYILGGYSYPTLQTAKARLLLNQPLQDSFYFAGEYILRDSSSTVDAALQSGKKVAEKILKNVSSTK